VQTCQLPGSSPPRPDLESCLGRAVTLLHGVPRVVTSGQDLPRPKLEGHAGPCTFLAYRFASVKGQKVEGRPLFEGRTLHGWKTGSRTRHYSHTGFFGVIGVTPIEKHCLLSLALQAEMLLIPRI
jgi:hypothetical protein